MIPKRSARWRARTRDINLFISLVTWLECGDYGRSWSVVIGGSSTRREYTRAHTLSRARRERLDGDARRRLSLPSRGRILYRVVAVSNRRRQVVRARRERNAVAPPGMRSTKRSASCSIVNNNKIIVIIICYMPRSWFAIIS